MIVGMMRAMTRPREKGTIRKEPGASLSVALVCPTAYRVGMANLGFQFLYNHLNSIPGFSAERFFFPVSTGKTEPRAALVSEESGRGLSHFPVIAFSVPFESDYPAIPGALLAAGIPPLQADRRPGDPIVLAGGVSVSMNPEPLARFLDLAFIGEMPEEKTKSPSGKNGLFEALAQAPAISAAQARDRQELLWNLKDIPGVYIPSAYEFRFGDDGLIKEIKPAPGFPERITAVKRLSKNARVPVSTLFSPDAEFGESLLIETNRGCGRGCRFCAAGWIHLPVRHRRFDMFKKDAELALTDDRTIGLVGSDLASHPELEESLSWIVNHGGRFSLSSIRPEGLTPKVIELLARTGQKTATLAPETATPRMKKVIGKEIPSERFYELVEKLVGAGIPNIRFYFMVGLPTETDEDAQAVVDFVLQSRKVFVEASRQKKRIGTIAIQLNPFIPKPWTPFQWAPMAHTRILQNRMAIIRKGLQNEPNLKVRVESVRQALYQAFLSRGDRRIARVILRVAEQQGRWSGAFKQEGIDPSFYAHRERSPHEIFPWDVTYHGIDKEKLRKLGERSLSLF